MICGVRLTGPVEPRLSGFVLGVRGFLFFLGVQAMFQNYGRRLKTGLVELSLVPPWARCQTTGTSLDHDGFRMLIWRSS